MRVAARATRAGEPIRRTHDGRLVVALSGAAAVVYATYALLRFHTFLTGSYDLVIFDQAIRSYSRFHLPVSIVKGVHNGFGPDFAVLGDHFSPILVLLAPLYWLWDDPRTLLLAQAVLFAAAIPPLWVFTRRELGRAAAYCVAAAYALSWPIASAIAFDFHEAAFAPVLTAVMLERFQAGWRASEGAGRSLARAWGRHDPRLHGVLAALALLLVKEDMGLLVAGYGLYLLVTRRERTLGAAFVVAGLAVTWLAARVLIPAFGGDPDYYWAYGALGDDPPEVIAHMVTRPWDALRLLVTPPIKAGTLALLMLPVLFAPLRSPLVLAALPLLAERMLASRFGNWWEPRFHYNAFIVVVLLAAGVDGARRFRADVRRWRVDVGVAWAAAALAVTVAVAGFYPLVSVLNPANYQRDARMRAAAAAVATVPSGAEVEAPNALGPQLSSRARVLLWDERPRWAPWVIADVGRPTFPLLSVAAQRDRLALLLRSGYHVVRQDAGFVVLRR
ncbi:MAG TPA: DUF2079 domain-containing protein [Streptosporangiaceae bacterium]|nr:DUF2079 domain-containing protein [Streptosporangiaceae bacterium]